MPDVKETFIENSHGRKRTTLVCDRPRSRIWRVEETGEYVKVVKGSHVVRQDASVDIEIATWLARNRRSWRHLRQQTHPGLLRVGERVVDNFGDEGYLCQALDVFEPHDPDHPARWNLRQFLLSAIQLARAAGVMHRAGFVHGDITPANVCFHQGLPVLIDYEMTVRAGQYVSLFESSSSYRAICCTPACCAPEQVLRERVTPAADVYCLGLTMLSWVSGKFGVQGAYFPQTDRQSMGMCTRAEYPHWDLVEARLQDDALVAILVGCLQLVPIDRYENGDALADALVQHLQHLSDTDLDRRIEVTQESSTPPTNLTQCLDHL